MLPAVRDPASTLSIHLAALADEAASLAGNARAAATKRAYTSDWTHFTNWCSGAALDAFPAAPTTVGLYLTAHRGSLSMATLERRVSSIAVAHRMAGYSCDTRAVPTMTKAIAYGSTAMPVEIGRRALVQGTICLSLTKTSNVMADSIPTPPSAQKPILSMASRLIHCTCIVRCLDSNGGLSSGTAFAFAFFRSGESSLPCLVTNKHVIKDAVKGSVVFTVARNDLPDYGNNVVVNFDNFGAQWLMHPDPGIDLAILPIASTLEQMATQGKRAFIITLDQSIVPTKEQRNDLTPLEDLLIVGYPDGITDTKNNTPITRRGITATPPNLDFGGEPKFLIDASIFPGSSGSPCFIFNNGSIPMPDGGLSIGSRVLLLGVVFAVAQHSVNGEIKILPAPTSTREVAVTLVPNNIGVCINSDKILDFEPILVSRGAVAPPGYVMRALSAP